MAHQTPQQGNLWLILYEPSDGREIFYLDLPMRVLEPLCLRPRKYLRYLGWCVLGIEGRVMLDIQDIGDEGELVDQGVYRYIVNATDNADPLARAIDLEVIKQRSTVHFWEPAHSGSTTTRINFVEALAERDGHCVFSRLSMVQGVHIIPYARGDEWFGSIINNRQAYEEDVSELLSINDIRNGLLVQPTLHNLMDSREFVILQTPNHVLDMDDVPGDPARFILRDTIKYEYPVGERFSLQLVDDSDRDTLLDLYPNNTAAAFKRGTHLPKPSALLLHYNYGAAIVKLWGHHVEVLDRPNVLRPQFVINPEFKSPSRGRNNRIIPIGNDTGSYIVRDSSGEEGEVAGGGATDATDNPTVVVRPMVGYRGWDEDDWMMFFSVNTPAARKRRRAAEEESSNRIERWATEVSNAESDESQSPE